MRRSVIAVASVLLALALAMRLRSGGPPFFARPATIVDHVGPGEHSQRAALILLPRIASLLPAGATVTCFRPIDGRSHDDGESYLTAISMLPRQHVRPPLATSSNDKPRFVVAIGSAFVDPAYREVSAFPEGRLYERAASR